MANNVPPEERPIFMTSSPIMEHDQEGNDTYFFEEDPSSSSSSSSFIGCSCFQFLWRPSSGTETRSLLNQTRQGEKYWVAEKLKEAKEYSELVAGPKWKNLIRKLGPYVKGKRSHQQQRQQYDAASYALNFDGGDEEEHVDGLYRNGSFRFPPTPPMEAIKNLR